jgi:hypothetical protein
MIPHPFFYQLALIALVWLFLMLPEGVAELWICYSLPQEETHQSE